MSAHDEVVYGGIDILIAKSPYHIVESSDGRAQVLDRNGQNCVTGRPEPWKDNQDFTNPEIAKEWCSLRGLKMERPKPLYSDR